jgi:hypothetical protein
LHARGINLHMLTRYLRQVAPAPCATIADNILLMVAAVAVERKRDLIRERAISAFPKRASHCCRPTARATSW